MKNTNLIQARKRVGLTQREVAEKAHITETGYQYYELGLREPKTKVANRISIVLNSDPITLFGT